MSSEKEKITIINERGESVEFSLSSTYHTNISRDVDGLSNVRNSVYSSHRIGQDGSSLLGNRIESRDIEIVGNINNRDIGVRNTHRRNLARILNPHFSLTLVYELGNHKRLISCKVDKEIKFKSVTAFERFTIQLSCLFPFWREEHETRNDIAMWMGAFEFPEPDGLELCDDEGWEIEYRELSLIVNAENKGDVDSGMRIEFRALGFLRTPSIINVNTGQFIKLNMSLEAGDRVVVSTGYNDKRVLLHRNGVITNAFRHLDVDSTYLQLSAGYNLFRYDAEYNIDNLEVSINHNNFYLVGR